MRPLAAALLPAALVMAGAVPVRAPAGRHAPRLPREASRWVGGPPGVDALRGGVTIVFVWTFG
jgi:hypothetical protein